VSGQRHAPASFYPPETGPICNKFNLWKETKARQLINQSAKT